MSTHTLDTKNLLCPMPVIRTQDKINTLNAGDILTVLTTDPGSKVDIPTWCRINHHEIITMEEDNALITLTIKVGKS